MWIILTMVGHSYLMDADHLKFKTYQECNKHIAGQTNKSCFTTKVRYKNGTTKHTRLK